MLSADSPQQTRPLLGQYQPFFAERTIAGAPKSALDSLKALIEGGLDQLPLPAGGATLQRWRVLSEVASHELSLGKLFESHTDALAILRELDPDYAPPRGSSWGIWASEPPDARVIASTDSDRRVTLNGKKAWCSGAGDLSHALLTVWGTDGAGPLLARVELNQPGVAASSDTWQAIGMADTSSVDLHFSQVEAQLVGDAGAYLRRPGFWHGGAGIAACWYGGALKLAQVLKASAKPPEGEALNPFRAAALGAVDVTLRQTAALLCETAAWIDAHPLEDAMVAALRVRLAAEACATQVLQLAGRSLGAGAFCKDAAFARMATDLPVFIRQSGGERDARALGDQIAADSGGCWAL